MHRRINTLQLLVNSALANLTQSSDVGVTFVALVESKSASAFITSRGARMQKEAAHDGQSCLHNRYSGERGASRWRWGSCVLC